jgi:hypothetical protein
LIDLLEGKAATAVPQRVSTVLMLRGSVAPPNAVMMDTSGATVGVRVERP